MPGILEPAVVLGQHEKILLYGEAGTGKTHCAATAPSPYFLVIGNKSELKTVYSKPFVEAHGVLRPVFDEILESRGPRGQFTTADAFDLACDTLDSMLELNRKGELPYEVKTIIIENATTLMDVQMNKAIEITYDMAKNVDKTALDRLRKKNVRVIGDLDYKPAQDLMDQFLTWLYDLPYHVVLIAHEHQEFAATFPGSRERKLVAVRPMFYGKQRTEIPRKFDNVWRTYKSGSGRNMVYEVMTEGKGSEDTDGTQIIGKSRVKGILSTIERNLDLTDAIERFRSYNPEDV